MSPRSTGSAVPLRARAAFAQGRLAALLPLPHAAFPSRSLPACLLTLRRQGISQAALRGIPCTGCIAWVSIPGLGDSWGPQAQPRHWLTGRTGHRTRLFLAAGAGESLALRGCRLYLGRACVTQGIHRETGTR